jgi:hypothetical protein
MTLEFHASHAWEWWGDDSSMLISYANDVFIIAIGELKKVSELWRVFW